MDTIETILITGGEYAGIVKINKSDFDHANKGHIRVNEGGSRLDEATGVVLSKDQVEDAEAADAELPYFKKAAAAKTPAPKSATK